jgi:hypothetical protein
VYPVIALPPSDTGAVKLTAAWVLPATAVTLVGAPGGTVVGITPIEATDAEELPTAFLANTKNE